jgi:hypothetical protein
MVTTPHTAWRPVLVTAVKGDQLTTSRRFRKTSRTRSSAASLDNRGSIRETVMFVKCVSRAEVRRPAAR